MIKTILVIDKENMKSDETDALAIALCHAFRLKSPAKGNMSWKQFTEAFPERVISE